MVKRELEAAGFHNRNIMALLKLLQRAMILLRSWTLVSIIEILWLY